MEQYQGELTLGDTETEEEATPGGFSVGWDVGQLSYGGNVEDETFSKIHSNYSDYSDNSQFYDAWKNIEDYTIMADNRGRHQRAIDGEAFMLDDKNNIIPGAGHFSGADLLYNMDAIKGALLAKKQGYSEDVFNNEYSNVTKAHSERLAKQKEGTSTATYIAGSLSAHILQPETAIDFMSPGKIMGSSVVKGAVKAFGVEAGVALIGESIREQRVREHMERASLEYTLWDSAKNILINSGFAGLIRGIGSAVIDTRTLNKIDSKIIDKTDKEIFARFAQRENYKLSQNTNTHIRLMEKAKHDMDNGKVADIADHTDIDINTKLDDTIDEVSIDDELKLNEAERGLPEQTQKFEQEFDSAPPMKDVPEDVYEGMATPQEADDLIAEMGKLDPEIKAEAKALNEQAQRVKEASEPTIGGSEDEATETVKGMFKKSLDTTEQYKGMSQADLDELDRIALENELVDDLGNPIVFSKFADNLAAGTVAGVEKDEQGNITFDAEKFVIGLGGYTVVKALLKNPKIQKELRGWAERAIEDLESKPGFGMVTGVKKIIESGKAKEIKPNALCFKGACDRVRRTEDGERFWQKMMETRVEIKEKEFTKNVDVKDLLDEGETWKDYKNMAIGEGEPLRYYKSDDNVYHFQHAGFEFIWDEAIKKPKGSE